MSVKKIFSIEQTLIYLSYSRHRNIIICVPNFIRRVQDKH